MDKKIFNESELPVRETYQLLPEIFKSSTNRKFLSATLDPLVQPGTLDRLSGYIGRAYGRTYNSSDIYLDQELSLRSAYQLEPGVVVTDSDNEKIVDFYDYIDVKSQLKFFNNTNERDDLTTGNQSYSWNPPIDWDKFINYREYYWLPQGPDTIEVAGQTQDVISEYRVRSQGENEFVFYPDGLTPNPGITLYRGQTYIFDVNTPGDPFYIRRNPQEGNIANYDDGVTNNGIEVGTVSITVPNNSPDLLYYQSGNNIDKVGMFRILSIDENTKIDIDTEVLGKVQYTSSNNIAFTNGLKVSFSGNVTPEKYASGEWLVDGVGSSINLISFQELDLPPVPNDDVDVLFDDGGWDNLPFDDAVSYPSTKDYITINRSSKDKNPWSRYNKWFHRSVIDYSANINNVVPKISEIARAKRPIIEFNSNLQLINHCAVAKKSIDFIDDFTTDVFSTIEGTAGYNIDNVDIFEGARILFTKDPDPLVQNKIFVVKKIAIQDNSIASNLQIALVEADDVDTQSGEGVIVKFGKNNAGLMYHFDGTQWIKSQLKTAVNQPPLFDIFDQNGNSFSNNTVYETSSFTGSSLLSYKVGSGAVDSELGFAIAYQNLNNSGDIVFNSNWDTDKFTYQVNAGNLTKNINTGYTKTNITLIDYSYHNLYIATDPVFDQAILQTYTLPNESSEVLFSNIIWETSTGSSLYFYINGEFIKDEYTVVSTIEGTRTFSFTNKKFKKGDTVTLKVFSDDEPNLGFYEFPKSLERNPLNDIISTFTLGQATDHLRSMVNYTEEFIGAFPGISNLRDLSDYQNKGQRFVKYDSVAATSLPLLCDKENNIVKSLRYTAKLYENFKSNLLKQSITLPFDSENVVDFLDDIISKIAGVKPDTSPFSDSDMIGSGAKKVTKYTIEDTGIKTFALSENFDLDTPSTKAVYLYINKVQLVHGVDYEFDSTFGFVRIIRDLIEDQELKIVEYFSTSFNFVPETPSSMGLYKTWVPQIYVDNSFVEPQIVIRGHDGSVTLGYGDFRDDLLLELEKRIYNNIKQKYDPEILDIDKLFGGYDNTGTFTKKQVDEILELEFLRWPLIRGIDLYQNSYHDGNNQFTWTYNKNLDITRGEQMPKYWKGLYLYLFDTISPHTTPWEMLGFTSKPSWWELEYGTAPYTSNNLILWEDLRDGVIKQGIRAGTHKRYTRLELLSYLPVDADGNLLSPLESDAIIDYSTDYTADFTFGDVSPSEAAWRRSSIYPYAIVIAACLLRPFETISLNLDRKIIKKNLVKQLVSVNTDTFITNNDVITSLNSNTRPDGLLAFVINYLKSNARNKTDLYNLFNNLDVKLSSRIKGFVDKQQQQYLLDSKNPQSTQTGIFLPTENFDIFFNVSSPQFTTRYSGVLIEKSGGGYKVSGYDQLNSIFKYFSFFAQQSDPVLNVGGVSEGFISWDPGKFYTKGTLVRFQNEFFRSAIAHESGETFEPDNWRQIDEVPIVGGAKGIKRTKFNEVDQLTLNYDTILETPQDVIDFLLGYGRLLETQGMVFDEYNKDLGVVQNWETAVREFLFWTTHNWAEGSILSVSPGATLLKFQNVGAVADNVLDSFYDYNILRADGTKIDAVDIDVFRGANELLISPEETDEGIFFAEINYIQKEHVVVFDDKSVFNDVIFDKGPGYRQERIRSKGFRTTDWDGDYTSPGFIFDNVNIKPWKQFTDYRLGDIVQYKEYNYTSKISQQGSESFVPANWTILDSSPTSGLVPNFDFRINQIEDYYETSIDGINSAQKQLAKHTVGFQQRDYLQEIAEDDVSQFKLFQGYSREKGTNNSIKKVFDKVSSVTDDKIVLDEEWAFRIGSVGGTSQISEAEFDLKAKSFKLNPQPIILDGSAVNKNDFQNYIVLTDKDYQLNNTSFKFPQKTYPVAKNSAGYVFSSDVQFVKNQLTDFLDNTVAISDINHGDNVWVTFEPGAWNVYRYVISNILIFNIEVPDVDRIVLVTNKVHDFKVGQIVGINNISTLTGFYQISAVEPKKIIIAISGFKDEPVIDESSFSYVSYFESVRVDDYDDVIDKGYSKLPVGAKLFVDNNQNTGKWEVVERTKQYNVTQISEYGIAFPTGTGSAVTFVPTLNQTIVGNPGKLVSGGSVVRESAVIVYSDGESGLIPLQVLTPKEGLKPSLLGSYASVISASDDGRWLVVGSPQASFIPSNYQELFDADADYEPGDIIVYSGKLYKATRRVFGDGSTIDLSSEDWTPVELTEANPLGDQLFLANKGYSRQGGVDIYEYTNGQWNLKNSLVSPRQGNGELFGSSISIGKSEGIEGTSGDVTLVVNEINNTGGIVSIKANGASGLNDKLFENVSGTDISTTGQNATFDVSRSTGTPIYDIEVRTGGTGYAVGDKLYVQGTRVGGQPATGSSNNDIIIVVKKVDNNGSILGADTFNNITGIPSSSVNELALFTVSKNKDVYNVRLRQNTSVSPAVPVQAGDGYKSRSIVRYNNFFYACVADTGIDKGVWSATSTYDSGDVVKFPANSSQYWNVLKTVTGITPGTDATAYNSYETIFPNSSPEYWEQVQGFPFNVPYDSDPTSSTFGTGNWVDWDEKDNQGNLIGYTPGTTIVITGNTVGGSSPENDIIIRLNQVSDNGQVGPFPTKREGEIEYFNFTGTAAIGIEYAGIPGPGSGIFLDVTPEDVSDPGVGAIFDIQRKSGAYSATVSVPGTGYVVGDEIRILGTDLGAVDESYYMSISAPGSRDDRGKVYLYQFDGVKWSFLQDKEFVGVFNINRSYVDGSIVWYQNAYYKATSFFTADGVATPATSDDWEVSNSVNKNIVPNVNAYVDDGSTMEQGTADDQVENIDIGDKFGTSTTMSQNSDILVSSAPYADTNNFENYKGVWRATETYVQGDVVRRNGTYYELDSDSSLTSIDDAPEIDNKWISKTDNSLPRTGVVFVYKKNTNKVYEFIQEINKNDVTTLSPGDEFGYKVVISKDAQTLFIGAPNADIDQKDQGSVFVFKWSNNRFVFNQKVQSNTKDYDEKFGSNLSISPDGKTLTVSAEGAQTFDPSTFDKDTTKFDRLTTGFADPVGVTGKVFVYNLYGSRWVLGEIFEDNLNNNEDFGKSLATSNTTIIVGSPKYLSTDPAFSEIVIGRIQKFEKILDTTPWNVIRKQLPQVDISKIKNLAAYEKNVYTKIADIDIVDNYKDKVLGIVEQNLDYKTPFDPAVYTISSNEELTTLDESQHWTSSHVGRIWWDTSKVKYLVYEQGDVVFRNGNWNKYAPGSSIDVYQWVETDLLPSQYVSERNNPDVTGTPLYPDDSVYSVKQLVNPSTGNVSNTKYYYWVKDKLTQEINSEKTLSAANVSNYIENPENAGVPYAFIVDSNKISISNLKGLLNSDDFSVNIQYYNTDKDVNLIHNEYLLSTEESKDNPNEDLERKWIDSLVGSDKLGNAIPDPALTDKNKYGIASRPRQTIFVNRNKAVEQTIEFINDALAILPLADEISYEYLNLIDAKPNIVKNLYDVAIDTEAQLRFQTTSNIREAELSATIVNGHINTIEIVNAGYGYKRAPLITIRGDGQGALATATIDSFGRITSVTVTNEGKKYLTATPTVRPYSVLVEKDSTVDGFWSIYAWSVREKKFFRSATQEFDTTKYWKTIDWWATGYAPDSRISYSLPGLYAEPEVTVEDGQLLRLDDYGSGGWAVLERTSGTDAVIIGKYKIVGRYQGTLEVINKFYDTTEESTGYDQTQTYDSNRYDTSAAKEFRNILNAAKYNIFVDELGGYWNKLFFVNLHYIFSEQLYVDWAFKTSFLNATHNVGYLEKKLNFRSDSLEAYQKYIEEVKPYSTKIRNYTSRYQNIENTNTTVSDFDVPPVYDDIINTIRPVKLGDPQIDLQPWNTWFNNYKFEVTKIILTDLGSTYSTAPQVVITGGGGSGARARAYISNRKVTRILLLSGGSGYTSAPTVELVGGVGTLTQNSAKATAIIGNTKARVFNSKIKFDRYSKTPTFSAFSATEKFAETETFVGTGRITTFDLKYPSTLDKNAITVFVDNEQQLASDYTVTLYTKLIDGLTVLKGRLTLLLAAQVDSVITIKYEKNDEVLDSLNRIDKYYKPTDGMLGIEKDVPDNGSAIKTDYSQLVTGMDYGGVIVQGATFDIGAGWDALPWFTEGWDSAESNDKDFYIAADDSTHEFVLPEVPESGKVYNIYIRRKGETKTTRLDASDFDNGSSATNPNAIMSTFIGDGSTNVITIPIPDEGIYVNDGDVLIFRPIESDGANDIQSANYIDADVSGGSLLGSSPYSTATGLLPEDIIIDGEKFISPDQVPAPEENIPGQVLENLSIKVFHKDRFGAPAVLSRIYTADGTTTTYKIDQHVLENTSLLVFVNKVLKEDQVDYTIDYQNNQVRFINIPTDGQIIEIFSLAVGGIELLDVREFTGDGTTRYFLTGAPFSDTGRVFATVNGIEITVGFVNSNGVVNTANNTLVEFGVAPAIDDLIQIVVLSEESGQSESIVRINQERINLTPGTKEYPIAFYDQLGSTDNSNVIVEYNGLLLKAIDSTFKIYDGEPIIKLNNDPVLSSGTIIPTEIKVFANGVQLKNATDYIFNGADNEIEIQTSEVKKGDSILIENLSNTNYQIENGNIKFSPLFTISANDYIDVTWFTQYTEVDIVRDVYTGNQSSYKLQRSVNSVSNVWVYKNGVRLTPNIDFYVASSGQSVYLKEDTSTTDVIETIVYSNKIYNTPISYEINRDVLNKSRYNRFQLTNIKLDKVLNYYDTDIVLTDASSLPDPATGKAGIVTINSEKIQYLTKNGNKLTGLRRGYLGTSIKEVHAKDTQVIDTGFTETVPYNDEQDKTDIVSDGTSLLIGPLEFVPRKGGTFTDSTLPTDYGRCDDIEVFVGGRRLYKDQFKMYDTTTAAYSPDGDVQYEAEFSVDGINEYIRLTDPVAAGTRITIIRRTGRTWYNRGETTVSNGTSLSESTTPIAKFLQNSSTELPE